MLIRKLMLGVAAIASLAGAQDRAMAEGSSRKDIVATAVEAGSFKTLAAALQTAGLVETLQGEGPFTVFAPTDEAFAALPEGTVDSLLMPENRQRLVAVLTYHVVPGKVLAADVITLGAAATVNGQRVDVKVDGPNVQIDDARVVSPDIECSNGVIHVIDKVLLPSADNIPETAANAGKFEVLLTAAKAAGLLDALAGDQPLTVFAPTDEAFDKLPEGTVESLLKPENKARLVSILKYHVVPGRIFSGDLLSGAEAQSLQGGVLTVASRRGKATVNDARLLATDIDASNGVIHVIDAVLLPPAAAADGADIAPQSSRRMTRVCPRSGRVVTHRVPRVQQQ